MGQNVPLSDSAHVTGWLLLGEVLRYYCIIMGFHVACRLFVFFLTEAQHNAFSALRSVLVWEIMSLDIRFQFLRSLNRFY